MLKGGLECRSLIREVGSGSAVRERGDRWKEGTEVSQCELMSRFPLRATSVHPLGGPRETTHGSHLRLSSLRDREARASTCPQYGLHP